MVAEVVNTKGMNEAFSVLLLMLKIGLPGNRTAIGPVFLQLWKHTSSSFQPHSLAVAYQLERTCLMVRLDV